MKALRELAERWRPYSAETEAMADELLSILDAEDDGGAVAWQEKVNEIANNIGESLNAGCDQGAVDRINVYVDELFALATHPARSGVVSDEDVRDAAKYRWLKGQKTSQEILAYIVFTKDVDHAIDAAIQGERHER